MESRKNMIRIEVDCNYYYLSPTTPTVSKRIIDQLKLSINQKVIAYQDEDEWVATVKFDQTFPKQYQWYVEFDEFVSNKPSKKLRILDYLTNIHDYNGEAIDGNLNCSCSCDTFRIYHTGKQTKGILAPFLIKKNNQLCIKAVCSNCGNSMIIYDSKVDGSRNKMINQVHIDYVDFNLFKCKNNTFKIIMKYNYLSENVKVDGMYSNDLENCLIDICNNCGKSIPLIEE